MIKLKILIVEGNTNDENINFQAAGCVPQSENFKLHVKHVGDSNYIRYPWIWCVWRRENVVDISFEDSINKINYGEDKEWLLQVMKSNKIKIETKIDKVLHYYRFNSNKTETQK